MPYILKNKNQKNSYLQQVFEHNRNKLTFQFTFFPFAALQFHTRREARQFGKMYKNFTLLKIKK